MQNDFKGDKSLVFAPSREGRQSSYKGVGKCPLLPQEKPCLYLSALLVCISSLCCCVCVGVCIISQTPDPLAIKRRRISGGLLSGGSGSSAGGAEQRKRKWGRQRNSSDSASTPTISTDILKVSRAAVKVNWST